MSARASTLWARLRADGIVAGDLSPPAADTPWYLAILLGVSAWIAAGCFFAGVLALFESIVDMAPLAFALGVGCCALALWLLRIARGRDFLEQAGIACSLAGQLLIGDALGHWTDALLPHALRATFWLGVAVVALAMYRWSRLPMHRVLCGVLVSVALMGAFDFDLPYRQPLAMPVLVWFAAALWWRSAQHDRIALGLAPLAWSASLVALVAIWLTQFAASDIVQDLRAETTVWLRDLAIAPLLPAAAWAALQRMPALPATTRRVALAIAVLLALLWLRAPGVAFGATLALAGFLLYRPALLATGLLGVACYLWFHYWQQDTSLLEKSLWLTASGIALLALRHIAPARLRRAGA